VTPMNIMYGDDSPAGTIVFRHTLVPIHRDGYAGKQNICALGQDEYILRRHCYRYLGVSRLRSAWPGVRCTHQRTGFPR
jgi:hypothetical protein